MSYDSLKQVTRMGWILAVGIFLVLSFLAADQQTSVTVSEDLSREFPGLIDAPTESESDQATALVFLRNLWGVLALAAMIPLSVYTRSRRHQARLMGCPECAERIQPDAKVCRFCGHRLEPPP